MYSTDYMYIQAVELWDVNLIGYSTCIDYMIPNS